MSQDSILLDVRGLDVDIAGESGMTHAVKRLELAISQRQTFALVGESGCGKSMTALALMRLLPENGRITDGRLDLEGADVFGLPEAEMRSVRGGRIGMIFQEPATSLNPVMRVGDQIVEAIEAHTTLRGAAARARAIEWLGKVGIPEPERRIDDYPFRLSGGQKQRVMIAMTLAGEPDFLIADEPTTALDVTIQAQILDLILELQKAMGTAVILITHDLGVVAETAQRVIVMYAGRKVEEAGIDELFAEPLHPYTRGLLASIPRLDAMAGGTSQPAQRLMEIPGMVPPLTSLPAGCAFAPRCPLADERCRATYPPYEEKRPRHWAACWHAGANDA